jgi:hypothetical protein
MYFGVLPALDKESLAVLQKAKLTPFSWHQHPKPSHVKAYSLLCLPAVCPSFASDVSPSMGCSKAPWGKQANFNAILVVDGL